MRDGITRRHRMTGVVLVLAVLATLLAVGGTASSALVPKQIVAGPGSSNVGYYTKAVTIKKGQKLVFRNLDVVGHNVVISSTVNSGPPKTLATNVPVKGVSNLARGKYSFYCAPHQTSMKGTLTVK